MFCHKKNPERFRLGMGMILVDFRTFLVSLCLLPTLWAYLDSATF